MYYNWKTKLSAKRVLCFITKFSEPLCSVQSAVCSLLALQPHARRLQELASRQTNPEEGTTTAGSVHCTPVARLVPKSTAVFHCTVYSRPQVVVTVIRAEHHAVLVAERIVAGVTRVSSHYQLIVGCLCQYSERTVLGVVPVAEVATWLQVELQLIAVVQCQLTEKFVAEPVVAVGVVKTDFKLRPRTIEEVGPVDVLLDQQRDALGYRTIVNISRL